MKYAEITTPRLLLRSAIMFEWEIKEMIGWLNNPLVVKYSEQRHKTHTMQSQMDYITSFKGDDVLLSIIHERTMIGTISARIDWPNQVANVGIMIGDHSKWRMGFGFEAWKGLCDKLLEGNVRKIEAGCMSCNRSMMSICSRYGMMEEGRQEDHFLCRDVPCDLVHWGKFK